MRLVICPLLVLILARLSAVDHPGWIGPVLKLPPQEQPALLTRLEVAVRVAGLEAETATTLTFRNPNSRILAGDLEFPLPDGAAVCGYALDIQGRMVDGVVVGMEQARVVFETETRRQVDPGLVEQVRGNLWRTRIFPLPAQGERTIRLTWVAPLTVVGNDAAFRLPLPRQELPALKLSVELAKSSSGAKPELSGIGDLILNDMQNLWRSEATLAQIKPGDDLLIRLPRLPSRVTALEQGDNGCYLSISELPPAVDPGQAPAAPRLLGLAWDASASRDPAALAKTRELLGQLLTAWPNTAVHLVVFRDRPEPGRHFPAGDAGKALLDHLAGLVLDGGTDLSALDLRQEAAPTVERWLLVTDGLSTLGHGLPLFGSLPVDVLTADTIRDGAVQTFIAAASGGQVIDLAAMTASVASKALTQPRPILRRVDAPTGLLADIQQRQSADGRAQVWAKVLGDGEITLVYGLAGREIPSRVTITRAGAVPGRLIARAWAAAKVQQLSVFGDRHAADLLALGQQYGLVTPSASLLVLERLDQYLAHRIMPPDTWPEMRDQYLAMAKQRQDLIVANRQHKVDQVLAEWHERVAWWKQEPGRIQAVKPLVDHPERRLLRIASTTPATEAAPPPATTPAVAPTPTKSLQSAADRTYFRGMVHSAEENALHLMAPGRPPESKSDGSDDRLATGAATVQVRAWDPNTPYLAAIKARPQAEAYAIYLQQRTTWAASPAFFLDCAGFLLPFDRTLGLRVLSNLAEMRIDDPHLLRVFAWRLTEADELERAIEILERVRRLRPEEPQSHRDLALLLAEQAERRQDLDSLARAVRLLYDVIEGTWQRFQGIEVTACMELNRTLVLAERLAQAKGGKMPDFSYIRPELRQNLDCDLRIVLAWDADATDLDLHVLEPGGQEAFYGNPRTTLGGLVSRDFTEGYGPEEYCLRRSPSGPFRVRCHYYGSRQQTLVGPATVSATIISHFGRTNETRRRMTLRLDRVRDMVDLGTISFDSQGLTAPAAPAAALPRARVQALKVGATRVQVEQALGRPEREDGSGLTVLVYRLEDGQTVRLGFGPDLLWAREAHPGAERELPLAR